MNDWLGEMLRRGHLTWTMVEGARLWSSDVAELGRGLSRKGPDSVGAGAPSDDVMRIAVRRRVGDVERRLGGKASPSFRVAWWVAVEGCTAGEAAVKLGEDVRTTTAMDLVRMALPVVAQVYGVRQDGPVRAA